LSIGEWALAGLMEYWSDGVSEQAPQNTGTGRLSRKH